MCPLRFASTFFGPVGQCVLAALVSLFAVAGATISEQSRIGAVCGREGIQRWECELVNGCLWDASARNPTQHKCLFPPMHLRRGTSASTESHGGRLKPPMPRRRLQVENIVYGTPNFPAVQDSTRVVAKVREETRAAVDRVDSLELQNSMPEGRVDLVSLQKPLAESYLALEQTAPDAGWGKGSQELRSWGEVLTNGEDTVAVACEISHESEVTPADDIELGMQLGDLTMEDVPLGEALASEIAMPSLMSPDRYAVLLRLCEDADLEECFPEFVDEQPEPKEPTVPSSKPESAVASSEAPAEALSVPGSADGSSTTSAEAPAEGTVVAEAPQFSIARGEDSPLVAAEALVDVVNVSLSSYEGSSPPDGLEYSDLTSDTSQTLETKTGQASGSEVSEPQEEILQLVAETEGDADVGSVVAPEVQDAPERRDAEAVASQSAPEEPVFIVPFSSVSGRGSFSPAHAIHEPDTPIWGGEESGTRQAFRSNATEPPDPIGPLPTSSPSLTAGEAKADSAGGAKSTMDGAHVPTTTPKSKSYNPAASSYSSSTSTSATSSSVGDSTSPASEPYYGGAAHDPVKVFGDYHPPSFSPKGDAPADENFGRCIVYRRIPCGGPKIGEEACRREGCCWLRIAASFTEHGCFSPEAR